MPRKRPTDLTKNDIINMIKGGVDPLPTDVTKGWYAPGKGWNTPVLMKHTFGFLLKLYKKRRREGG